MMDTTRARCAAYALIALAALAGTASQLPSYAALGLLQGNVQFWQDTLANPASRFITMDVFFVFLVVWPWMIGEARRLRMRGLPWYFLGSLLVAFSVALPVFMLHRERALQRLAQVTSPHPAEHAPSPRQWTWWSVLAVAVATLLYTLRASGLL
ncbi:DUF2834 domain-containing protein [Aquabacterium fontiphilum]|jgi:hypothetical protein|uniref:DUF2834 domain-containing protein n=1 Tax=Aquabacterium fontiphilum TaxID=450365 RepID=UPI001378C418|nr:DUF2834 domain-containing protein [Aquabacterium fontiphilum]NBD19348.1 DUF2834 domain-containing protein [Aquabacterium fontiphilum]